MNYYKNKWKYEKKETKPKKDKVMNFDKYPLNKYTNFTTKGIEEPIIFCNHTDNYCLDSRIFYPNINQYIQAVFIDPGVTSCAIRIVKYFLGTGYIENVWFGIHNFGIGIDQMIKGVEDGLEPIKQLLIMSHHIVIESQFMKKEINFRVFQHMISYIESITRNQGMRPIIIEVSIALKTVFIGGPKTQRQNNNVDIKEWSKLKARHELIQRNDFISLSILECTLNKQDEDYCDTVCYEYAWWIYIKLIKSIFKDVNWLYNLL